MECDCEELAKLILDLRKSIREEEAAVDAYFERGQRAKKSVPGGLPEEMAAELAMIYQDHVLPEEQEHQREFNQALTKLTLRLMKDCQCPEISKIIW